MRIFEDNVKIIMNKNLQKNIGLLDLGPKLKTVAKASIKRNLVSSFECVIERDTPALTGLRTSVSWYKPFPGLGLAQL